MTDVVNFLPVLSGSALRERERERNSNRSFQSIFDDSHGAMRLFMWHPCQKDVASCLLQLLGRIDETLT